MGIRSVALYNALLSDLTEHLPFGPVGLGSVPPDASYKQWSAALLITSILKKWIPDDTKAADLLAKETFLASNKKCKDWSTDRMMLADEQLFGEFQREVDHFLHPKGEQLFSSYREILDEGRVGPGAAVGARGGSMYAKLYASQLTTTSENLYLLYRCHVQNDPNHLDAEVHRLKMLGPVSVVESSNTTFVPKTSSISRMVCVEPSLNMFFQLGLGTLLEKRLSSRFKTRLDVQPSINRRLAGLGSKDGSFSTIDLSSASDSISLNLCKKIFPSWFFETLLELRSPSTVIDGEVVPLNMMSTMGNGFTFPLQTMIFSCMIRACYRLANLQIDDTADGRNWACFGDDLICDIRCHSYLIRLLNTCGFSVNNSKTFCEGPFRESCGTDWLFGQPVRGVYIRKLTSPQDIFVAINLLNGWSAYTGIPLIEGIQTLVGMLHPNLRDWFVPFAENMDAGIRVPSIVLKRKHYRYNKNCTMVYRAFTAMPKYIRFEEGTIRVPRQVKELIYNPSGLLLSLLYGELVACKMAVRNNHPLYRVKLRCTPFWDYAATGSLVNGYEISWQQWETAVLLNCSNQ